MISREYFFLSREIKTDSGAHTKKQATIIISAALSVALSLMVLDGAQAAEYGTTLQGGVYITSNVNQSSVPVVDATANFIWGGTYKEQTPRLAVDFIGSVETSMLRNSGESTIYPRGDLTVNTVLLTERLDWVLQDRMEVVRIDVLQADIPTNQEIANVFITGPIVKLRFGPADKGFVEARYEIATFQRSSIKNSTKYGGALRWERTLSPSKTFSANVEAKKVLAYQDYKKYDGYLVYSRIGPKSDLSLKFGETLIDQYTSSKIDENIYQLGYRYKVNTRSNWFLETGRQLSDIGEAIVLPVVSEDPLTRDAGLFLQEGASLTYSYAYAENVATASLFRRSRNYYQIALAEKANGVRVNYTKRTDRATSWTFRGEYADTLYSDSPNTNIEREVGVEYGFDVNRELTWKTGLLYRDRASVNVSRNFDETVFHSYLLLKRMNVRH